MMLEYWVGATYFIKETFPIFITYMGFYYFLKIIDYNVRKEVLK